MSWTSRLLPRSLRSRLILSFGLLIFLSLFLAGLATVYLLREQQERNAKEKVGLLAEPIALRAAKLEAEGRSPGEILQVLVREYPGVRVLLVDRDGFVQADSQGTLDGQTIEQFAQATPEGRPGASRYQTRSLRAPGDDLLLFWTPKGLVFFSPALQTVVAVPESDVSQAWRDLLPRLFLAAGVAFFAGVIAASLLARSITRPLRQITAASEEMARGRYDQQIPAYGGEEVGRLAEAFNHMARQVSRSHRTLRDFLANVSHELKTPLTSIQGFSQAMLDGALAKPQDYAEAGRIINDEAVRMRGLVDDLLYLSQMEAGETTLQPEPLDPNELLRATMERFARRAGQAGVALRLETSPLPRIEADGRRLEQALANVVDNAVRHTPSGGTVTLRSFWQDGEVRLAVHNTGSVIPPEALPHIFERFFQADPAGARKDGNTGLGLAITKEIVEAHGGAVRATSSEAEGTEFVITLPAPQGAEAPDNERAWARPAG
ncbi:MAG TPA: ATP-binding protein [Dehalococcoidia bacterium]|nr:ATP-binding protein [Dehalococcoidia bacterium]